MEQRHGFPFILSDRSRSRPVISARWLPPTAALRSQVTAIAHVDNRAQALRALPASGALLAIRFGGTVFDGDTALPAVSLTGIQQAARRFHYSGPVRSVLLRLTPQAVRSFGAEAAELVDRTVGLPDLGCNALASLPEELARAADTATLLGCVERAFSPLRLRPDPLIERAIRLLERPVAERAESSAHGPLVAYTARELGVSERQLGRRFVAAVGLSPRRFASLRRFERALRLLPHGATCAEVAHAAGYFDESHFSRECQRITGETPGALRRSQGSAIRFRVSDLYNSAASR